MLGKDKVALSGGIDTAGLPPFKKTFVSPAVALQYFGGHPKAKIEATYDGLTSRSNFKTADCQCSRFMSLAKKLRLLLDKIT